MRKTRILIGVLLVGLIGFCVFSYENNYRERWTSRTSPLPDSTIEDLCDRLELDENDRLCKLEKDIYAADFYSIIEEKIQPKDQEWLDIEQVNELLGEYLEDECFATPVNEKYIECDYDIRGDKVFYITARFTPDGELDKLFFGLETW